MNHEEKTARWAIVFIFAALFVGAWIGRASIFVSLEKMTAERERAQSDAALLQDIADMREQLFQQDERKLDAVRWCVTSSPTPIECVRWSVNNTR